MSENQKTKVADLPQEEKEKLLNEAKELNLRGLFDTWNVETLKNKIAEAKAKLNEQNPPANEQTDGVNDEQEPAADNAAPKVNKGGGQAYDKDKKKQKPVVKICHICRSKVVDGKCTGCGFQLKK